MTDALALPPLPEGFTLDKPANDNGLPPLPEGFGLDSPAASKLPPLPDGFVLDDPKAAAQPKPGIIDKIGQPITDAKQAESMANAQGAGVIEGAKNLAKGIGERFVQLEGGAVRGMATALPGSDPVSDFIYWATGTEKPANYPTPEEVTKTGQEVAKQMESVDLGFEEGDSWEDVKKAPASKFLPWAFKQGLLSAPDMALAMASLPGYAAIRSGELAQDRAENDQRTDATVEDMLKAAPAAVVSGLLDRIGGRAMFGLDDVAVQTIKQVPKEVAKATVKEGVTEAAQEGIEDVATTAGTKAGWKPADMAERMLAAALAGGVTGGTVRAGTGTLEAATNTDTPVEGDQSATVETENPQLKAPVTQDGGEERASPLVSSSPSTTPEERAILRRTSMPDEDIDAMSPEEREAKVAEARAAGIRVNGAMVRAAEQYQLPAAEPVPANVPVPEPRPEPVAEVPQQPVESETPVEAPVVIPETVPAPVERPDPKTVAREKLAQYQQRKADVEQAVSNVQPELESAVESSVKQDQAQDTTVDKALGAPLSTQVLRSVYEDTKREAAQDKQAENALSPVQEMLAKAVDESISEKPKTPEVVYHGTSSGGFDSFDAYQGKYGLFGSGGYFTESPDIALEYTRKGKGTRPAVYRAKLNIQNPLDMDASPDKMAWQKAFRDYLDDVDVERAQSNEDLYRAVEEFLSGEMIPRWEGAETMQDGVRAMGYDGITHIGGGRHKASKGVKHRVWIAFEPEQVTDFRRREASEEAGADNKPQLVIPGAERAPDADIAQRRADAPLKAKAPQKDPGGLFSDDVNEPQLFDKPASDKPTRTYKSESGKKRDMDLLTEVVNRIAGVDPKFAETINLSKEGSKLWGRDDVTKARGQYNATDDVITLALDLMNWDAANHEAFHRLQNKFLTDKERAALKSDERRLRAFLITNGEKQASVDRMARVEVEAEAFAKWVAKAEQPAKINTILRRAWERLAKMLRQVRNLLNGRGFKTYEDIFGEAKEGKTKERTPREKGVMAESTTLYSLVDDRATPEDRPAKPKTSVPNAPAKPKNRFSDRVKVASKQVAAWAKSKGGKYDRLTEGDEETLAELTTRKVLDYLDPVLRMQQKVGVKIEDHADVYQTARLAEGTIRHELQVMDEKYVQPAIKELAVVGATEKDLSDYMYAMHVPERNYKVGLRNEPDSDLYKAATDPSIRGASGMSTNEAKDLLRELAKDREKFMGIRRAASHIRAMLDDGLKRQLRAGLINKSTYDELIQQWQHYVPLRAESDTDGTGGGMPSKSRGFDVRGDEFKGATGRYTKADNVVNYAVNNAEQSIIRAEKNKAATAALRFINQFDPEGESIAKVYWSEDPEKLGDITKAPPVYKRVLDKDGKVTNRKVNAFQMKDDVLAAKIGGKTYYMQFADPKVGLALKKMTFGELGVAMKMVRTVSNWQSLINTRANPAFVPINMLRDIQTGATLAMNKDFKAGEIAKMVGNIPSAWGALWRDARGKPGSGKWDKIVADFKANGGKISFDQYNTVEETAKKIQKDLAKAGSRGIAGKTWRGFIDLVENLNDTIENGMRVAVFNAAVEQGRTPKRAAFLARDLTVDFQKKGEITPHMNALYTFFNASVQGNFNFARALYRSRKIKVAMGALVMAGYAQHVINMALAGDDDDGENAYIKMLRNEPWTFERNIVLFLPGSKDYIKLPLGFGMNAFWHLGVQGGAVTTGDKGFLDATLDSTRVGFDAFNPLGSGGWVSMFLPSVIDPIWELGTNENFSGKPIYPQENQYDPAPPPKSEQAFSSTSPAARWGAETLNKISGGSDKLPGAIDVYPDSLEYLWGWFTGGVGRFASQTVETAQRGVDLDFEPKKTPFVRSFYGQVDDQGKRSEYFSQREKVQYVKGKMKEFQEAGDQEGLKDFMADHEREKKAIDAFDTAEKMRRKINKQRRALEKRGDSADRLKMLDERELEIMNRARKAFFEAGKDDQP